MDKTKINKKLLVVLMESPFYFSIPLKMRLEFIKFFSQPSVYNLVHKYNQHLINKESDSKQHFDEPLIINDFKNSFASELLALGYL